MGLPSITPLRNLMILVAKMKMIKTHLYSFLEDKRFYFVVIVNNKEAILLD